MLVQGEAASASPYCRLTTDYKIWPDETPRQFHHTMIRDGALPIYGAMWNTGLTQAATVLHGPPRDLSVSFNEYLGKLIAVYSGIFSNDVWMRSASHPEGPWSAATKLFTAPPPSSGNDYAGKEHPELAGTGDRSLVVSYARSTGTFDGQIRLSSVALP